MFTYDAGAQIATLRPGPRPPGAPWPRRSSPGGPRRLRASHRPRASHCPRAPGRALPGHISAWVLLSRRIGRAPGQSAPRVLLSGPSPAPTWPGSTVMAGRRGARRDRWPSSPPGAAWPGTPAREVAGRRSKGARSGGRPPARASGPWPPRRTAAPARLSGQVEEMEPGRESPAGPPRPRPGRCRTLARTAYSRRSVRSAALTRSSSPGPVAASESASLDASRASPSE
jgi:hypothetical protein